MVEGMVLFTGCGSDEKGCRRDRITLSTLSTASCQELIFVGLYYYRNHDLAKRGIIEFIY